MKALFLAGGKSVRMWPLSFDKNLIDFCGQSLAFHSLSLAKAAGLSDFVIVGNEGNKSKLEEIVKKTGIKGEVILQKKPGQGGAILSARNQIKNQDVLIINANDVFEENLYRQILTKVRDEKNEAILVGYQTDSYFPGGYLKVKNGEVCEIVEKPSPDKVPSNLVRLVCDYFSDSKKLLEALERTRTEKDDLYEKAMDQMIRKGMKFSYIAYKGFWKSIKYSWHILDLMEYFLSKIETSISKKAEISKKATVDGPVVLEDDVRILENAVVKGPCWIGKNSIIGNGALVRQSIIGEDCVVGYNTEITRSYVGPSCWFHTNYIGDSVLDENVSFGSGAITANLRLDEGQIYSEIKGSKINTQRNKLGNIIGKNVRIGINAMLMPGVKIGANSFVGSGVILSEDLEENKFCVVKQEQQITRNRLGSDTKKREKFRKKLS
jgi:bifunctional UDP-N-acetylglucosamine pyrophosphorylase/glucosamine-1-phosphate N-acetyltransferase